MTFHSAVTFLQELQPFRLAESTVAKAEEIVALGLCVASVGIDNRGCQRGRGGTHEVLDG